MRRADLWAPVPLEIGGPVAYAPHWLWLGIALAVLAAVLPVAWWWLTRPRAEKQAVEAPRTPASALEEARAAIAAVTDGHARGTTSDRAAHQELSRVVRRFVAQVSGWPVDHMGLSDLREAMGRDPRLAGLTDYVALLSPPSFGPDGTGDVPGAAREADALVTRWAQALTSPEVTR